MAHAQHARPGRRARHEPRSADWVGAGVAVATLIAYVAWLGWDQVKDVAPDGSTSGPYQAWQVVGLVATLGVIGVVGGWMGRPLATAAAAAIAMGACFAIDGATEPPIYNDGLWVVGAFFTTVGVALFMVPVSCATAALVAPSRNRSPEGGSTSG
jgi:hypothetical protein